MANTVEIIITAKDQASGVIQGLGSSFSGLAGIGRAALLPVLGLATAGLGALAGALGYVFTEAMEAQEVQAQLGAVLASTGGAAGVTADMANELATQLSGMTRFSDEAILAGENMLLTFTNIGKDVFPEATQTILDMSQALGQDLQSSAIQLGKALNDPIAGVTALQRVGVTFTDEQKDMIAAMVEAGDIMGAQTLILDELQKEFGGSAEAAGQTFAGQLDILKNSLSNVAEGIGTALLPIGQQLLNDFIIPAVPQIIALGEKIGNLITIIADAGFGSIEAREALAGIFGDEVATNIQNAILWFTGLKDTIMTFVTETLIPFVTEHKEALIAAFVAIGAAIAVAGIAAAIAAIANPVTLLIVAVGLLAAAWTENWGGMRTALTEFWEQNLQPLFNDLVAWLSTNIPIAIQALSDFWTGTLLPAITIVWEYITGSLVPLFTSLWELLSVAGTLAITALSGLWENILLPALTKVWEFISVYLQPIFDTLATFIQDTFGPIIEKFSGDGFLGALSTAFDGIATAISGVIGWIDTMITKLLSVELPWWLTPGSPTPFEWGLIGIRRELEAISSTALPAFASAMAPMQAASAGPASILDRRQMNVYGVTIQTSQSPRSVLADLQNARPRVG